MVGNHIICTTYSASFFYVLFFGIQELRISNSAVTLPTGDQSSFISFIRVFYIINYATDCITYSFLPSGMQGHQTCGCDSFHLRGKRERPAEADRSTCLFGLRRSAFRIRETLFSVLQGLDSPCDILESSKQFDCKHW